MARLRRHRSGRRCAAAAGGFALLLLAGTGAIAGTPAPLDRPGPAMALLTAGPTTWHSRCAGRDCRSEIEVRVDARRSLLKLWLAHSEAGQDFVAVLAPLGIYLPGTVQLSLDGGHSAVAALPLIDCSPQGCRGLAPVSAALLAGLSGAGTVTVLMQDSRTRGRIGVVVPMTGFRDSLVPMMLKRG